jgi:Mg-chelatase subunit ChlD
LLIIAIAIVTNQIITVNLTSNEELEKINFRKEASNILETLLNSEKCLAMKKIGTTEKVINISTLNYFQSIYSEIEPDCARNYEYGYYVKIEKFNFTKISGSYDPKIPIGNRDIVLILDNSLSMTGERFNAAKSAAIQLVSCALDTDRVAIVSFGGGYCGAEGLPMRSISTEKDILTYQIDSLLDTWHGTPLIDSLKKSEEILMGADPNKFRMIILFTDGRETCCDACRNDPLNEIGTSDCLGPCEKSLCEFAINDISFLKNNNIPIYSIYLGNETIGIEQTNCTSEQTGGKFYNIADVEDIDILGKLFCRIVAGERETTEDYQEWFFGSKNHSIDDALKNYVTISMPVSIKITDTKTQPGLATIRLYKGELEELVGSIDKTCETGLETSKKIYISYPVKLDGNSICMDNAGRISCRKFACENVKFEGINSPGMYDFYFKKEDNSVTVIV